MSANDVDGGNAGEDSRTQELKKRLIELEKEYLKKEILDELKSAGGAGGKSFTQNPAFLLLLGFLLTGVMGTWFTSFWQGRQQEVDRAQQARARALQQKYEAADQINKAVAEVYTATQVMLNPLIYQPPDEAMFDEAAFDKEVTERELYWKHSNRAWLVNSYTLKQKLAVNFKSEAALSLYDDIERHVLNVSFEFNDIMPMLKKDKLKALRGPRIAEAKEELLQRTNRPGGVRDKLGQLMRVLTEEIRSEENAGPGG
ncbi:MAG TPA: hypothetical protein VN282_18760 [Pyrinomonadaceae bacterium]|nr:hypothetical protein [Pyrinomonadaceae bacterium]